MTKVACTHCGLPVPRGLIEPDADQQFCCHGCRTVYQMIHEHGLDAFYHLRDAADETPEKAATTGGRFDEFADPTFTRLYCRPCGEQVMSVDLALEGVHCAACVWLIEKLPRVAPGVIEARLSLASHQVRLRWDTRLIDLPRIARTLDRLGYPPHAVRGRDAQDARRREDRRHLVRIAVAGACAGNLMLLAFALYAGMFGRMEPQYEALFRYLSLGIGLVAIAWPGGVFFRGAWAALRTRSTHLDLPIALALLVGAAVGTFNVVTGRGDIYFDTLGVLVLLLLVGRYIQHRQQRRASDALELLFSLTPGKARRVADDGEAQDVPIEALGAGDIVEVRAGETIPADGQITVGESDLGAAVITGESRPVRVGAGDAVHAGSTNLGSTLRVRITAAGKHSRVGQLMAMVEEFASRRSAVVQWADRIAGWFVLTVITLAAVTLGMWLLIDPSVAFDHTVALLIVACPCALGLATPLSIAVAIGAAAQRDIMIKGGDVLDRLARARRRGGTILLDKTGTLTAGQTQLVRWEGDESIKPIVAAVERQSSHHVARALAAALSDDEDSEPAAVTQVQQHDAGITATCEGSAITIGTPAFVAAQGVTIEDHLKREIDAALDRQHTPIVIARAKHAVALAWVGDALRPGVAEAIARLKAENWRIGLLSGDDPRVVAAVAQQVGIDPAQAHGGVSPEAKTAFVADAQRRGPVLMIGDGVNDAAALAAADLGVAVHGGAEASLAAADVYLARPGLEPLEALFALSARAMRAIRRVTLFSLGYNATALTLAMAGLINPLVAAIIMPLSSLVVISHALGTRAAWGRRAVAA
jgi:Cu2+-exporting ATPase